MNRNTYTYFKDFKAELEKLSRDMEKFKDADPIHEGELTDADFLVAYHKGHYWRVTRVAGIPLELHAFQYGVKTASVVLVDHGEVVKVPINNLFKVPMGDMLRKVDPLCFRAHIADVIPVSMGGEWSDDAISCFKRNTLRDDLKLIQRGAVTETSMPVELLYSDSFTETPFSPVRIIETTMSRRLLSLGYARAKPIENDDLLEDVEDDITSEDETLTIPEESGPVVTNWLPPCMLEMSDDESAPTKMRITSVDGACQIYGHPKNARNQIRAMSAYYEAIYDLDDHPEDSKEEWRLGEACVAKFEYDRWFRAQIVEVSPCRKKVAVMYVDYGNVRQVNIRDLRIPRAFQNRVCMTSINLPNLKERSIWSSLI